MQSLTRIGISRAFFWSSLPCFVRVIRTTLSSSLLRDRVTCPACSIFFRSGESYTNGSTVTACSSTLLTTLRHKTQQSETPFGSDTLQFFSADPSGKASLALLTYGNEHASKLRGVSANGETSFEVDCGEKLKGMSRSSAYTSVLTDDAVLTYNNSGLCVGTLHLVQAARSICLNDRTVFVLFNDRIEAFPASGEHTQPEE